jgi:hypothetical protein
MIHSSVARIERNAVLHVARRRRRSHAEVFNFTLHREKQPILQIGAASPMSFLPVNPKSRFRVQKKKKLAAFRRP